MVPGIGVQVPVAGKGTVSAVVAAGVRGGVNAPEDRVYFMVLLNPSEGVLYSVVIAHAVNLQVLELVTGVGPGDKGDVCAALSRDRVGLAVVSG